MSSLLLGSDELQLFFFSVKRHFTDTPEHGFAMTLN